MMNRREFLKAGGAFSLIALLGGYSYIGLKNEPRWSEVQNFIGHFFDKKGCKLYIVNKFQNKAIEYKLSKRYDLTTAYYCKTILI